MPKPNKRQEAEDGAEGTATKRARLAHEHEAKPSTECSTPGASVASTPSTVRRKLATPASRGSSWLHRLGAKLEAATPSSSKQATSSTPRSKMSCDVGACKGRKREISIDNSRAGVGDPKGQCATEMCPGVATLNTPAAPGHAVGKRKASSDLPSGGTPAKRATPAKEAPLGDAAKQAAPADAHPQPAGKRGHHRTTPATAQSKPASGSKVVAQQALPPQAQHTVHGVSIGSTEDGTVYVWGGRVQRVHSQLCKLFHFRPVKVPVQDGTLYASSWALTREETEFVRASLELRTAALRSDKELPVDLVCLPTALPLPTRFHPRDSSGHPMEGPSLSKTPRHKGRQFFTSAANSPVASKSTGGRQLMMMMMREFIWADGTQYGLDAQGSGGRRTRKEDSRHTGAGSDGSSECSRRSLTSSSGDDSER